MLDVREATCILVLAVACSAAPLEPAREPQTPPPSPPVRASAPELVLQGGHVGWIHALALSSRGDRAALLSLDHPDLGQTLRSPIPFATLSVVDVPSGVTRAAWRVPAPERSGAATVRFGGGDRLLTVDGRVARAVRLTDGLTRVFDFGELALPRDLASAVVWRPDAVEHRTARGKTLWSSSVEAFDLSLDREGALRFRVGSTLLGIDAWGRKTSSVEVSEETDARAVLARSLDGRWSVERSNHGHELLEGPTARASLSDATSVDDDALFVEPSFAFSPIDDRLWACRVIRPEEDGEARVRCWELDRAGHSVRHFDVHPERELDRDERTLGAHLVIARSGHLVIAASRSAWITTPTGEVVHSLEDEELEVLVRGAMETDDGSIALSSAVALGWWGPSGAGASLCPDLPDREARLRRVEGVPTAFAWRFVCPLGEPATMAGPMHAVSPDGHGRVVSEEDSFAGGVARLTRGGRVTPLEGTDDVCSFDGCYPRARFSPDGRWLLLDGALFDAHTGRRIRALSASETVDRAWRRTVRIVERGGALHAVVFDLLEAEVELAAHALGSPEAFYRAEARVLVVRERGTRLVFSLADHDPSRPWWSLLTDAVVTRDGGRLTVTWLDDGETSVERVPVGAPIAVDPERGRLAWCDLDELKVWRLGESPARSLGSCAGRAVHVGERYVVTADGSRARVTRLDDGRGLWVRTVIRPRHHAWTIAEDDAGRFWIDPARMAHVRRRAAGPLLDAAVSEVTVHTEGYDPELVRRFFAP